jgi:hypothetical protein
VAALNAASNAISWGTSLDIKSRIHARRVGDDGKSDYAADDGGGVLILMVVMMVLVI